MKVLIIGAMGQLGKALQRTAPVSAQVEAVDQSQCDLTCPQSIRSVIERSKPEILVNAAAYTAVDKAEEAQDLARAVNADAVGTMVDALRSHGGKLVHVSTDFVFSGNSSRAYRPDDDRDPLSVYGKSKADGEDHLRASDLLIRTSWLYEAGGVNFVRTMISLMKQREELRIVADQIGAPTWAKALARIIWGLVERGAAGTYHYSDAGVATWYDFAVAIAEGAKQFGLIDRSPLVRPIASEAYPTLARRPRFSLLDSGATHEFLGTQPTHWRENLWNMLREEKSSD